MGSGDIAYYFAMHPTLRGIVTAMDECHNRQVCDGYEYLCVQEVALSFDDSQFDVIINSHVIEHVGDRGAQREHPREMRRGLKLTSMGYLDSLNSGILTSCGRDS